MPESAPGNDREFFTSTKMVTLGIWKKQKI